MWDWGDAAWWVGGPARDLAILTNEQRQAEAKRGLEAAQAAAAQSATAAKDTVDRAVQSSIETAGKTAATIGGHAARETRNAAISGLVTLAATPAIVVGTLYAVAVGVGVAPPPAWTVRLARRGARWFR